MLRWSRKKSILGLAGVGQKRLCWDKNGKDNTRIRRGVGRNRLNWDKET